MEQHPAYWELSNAFFPDKACDARGGRRCKHQNMDEDYPRYKNKAHGNKEGECSIKKHEYIKRNQTELDIKAAVKQVRYSVFVLCGTKSSKYIP